MPPPLPPAELPDRVELVSVRVPELKIAPPLLSMPALPPVIVRFSSVAVTPELTPMMRKSGVPAAVLRAMVTPTDGPAMVVSPVVSVSVSWPAVRVIVFGVLKTVLSKVDRVGPAWSNSPDAIARAGRSGRRWPSSSGAVDE